jgi:hypothetical protein
VKFGPVWQRVQAPSAKKRTIPRWASGVSADSPAPSRSRSARANLSNALSREIRVRS